MLLYFKLYRNIKHIRYNDILFDGSYRSLGKQAYSNILKKTPKNENFYIKILIFFSNFCSKHRLWVVIRTASVRQF